MYLNAACEQDEERCRTVFSQADKADKARFLKKTSLARARDKGSHAR